MFLKGFGMLVVTLAVFSFFSLKMPKGGEAMSGLARAAIATFLVEAICKYILGDFAGIPFFAEVGEAAGNMGGTAAAALVGLSMGTDPVMAIASAAALRNFGILPGFIVGYVLHFALRPVKKLPNGIDTILGAILAASAGYGLAYILNPGITALLNTVGTAIIAATRQSPVVMGILLGGIIKIVCTSPLSSMALTAMLALTDLPMGIAAIACFGGSFTNGVMFRKLRLGPGASVAAVMLEPLTQADIVSKNPLPIYCSNFIGGGLSGLGAALLGIVCNAPGTASPIPGMLAPFAFNPPLRVLMALCLAAAGGTFAGLVSAPVFSRLEKKGKIKIYRKK